MNKFDLENLADIRIKEAGILLREASYPGAYYLAGYAVECILKACIAKDVRQFDFPNKKRVLDSHTHDFSKLIDVATLRKELNDKESRDPQFKLNWAVVSNWNEQNRYDPNIEEQEANDIYNAIIDRNSGVLVWLKSYL